MVYTMDDIIVMFPSSKRLAFESEFDMEIAKVYSVGQILTTYEGFLLQQEIALKHVCDKFEFAYEININGLVRRQFEHAQLLNFTVLHPLYDSVRVLYSTAHDQARGQPGQPDRPQQSDAPKELVYRRMMGNVTSLQQNMTPRVLVNIVRSVLIFLCVSHANGYVHMDVKPENILYDISKSTEVSCVLADYGLMTPMEEVFQNIKKRGAFFQGTVGFISPLLTTDDEENKVYHKFTAIVNEADRYRAAAEEAAAAKKPQRGGADGDGDGKKNGKDAGRDENVDRFWLSFFEHQKRRLDQPSQLGKIDLQSLALTLHYLFARVPFSDTLLTKHSREHRAVKLLIPRLLLHGPRNSATAADALRYFYDLLGTDVKTDPSVERALHAQPVPSSLI